MDEWMKDAEIEVEIRPDGSVHFKVSGVPGEGCEVVEKMLLEALQSEVVEREHTPEFYRQAAQTGSLSDRLKAWLNRK